MRVIGTAGHVDHGKSTLVRRLTGIDPDRLAEEKAREMTIDLGFAWLTLPDGSQVGIIDVPGHRDFIENMLAGVGGIDAALLVIAADEGVMPQTREHLAILDLLQIKTGVIALTKTDLVNDTGWLELVEAEIRETVQATVLANAPIVPVSAVSGDGLNGLLAALGEALAGLPPTPDLGRPRLPVDRVFTLSGFGTIVTGTLVGGTLATGDEVEFQPTGVRGRVRGLQSYRQAVSIAQPGSRVAVNLSGVDRQLVRRGDVLTRPGQMRPATLLDVFFRHLPDASRPLRHNAQVKVFCGAAEVMAHARLLSADMLAPGEEGWLQLRLDAPLAAAPGDRFILRYPSPPETIGGGVVVDPHPARKWRRMQPDVLAALATRLEGSPAQRIAQLAGGPEPVQPQTLARQTGMPEAETAITEALNSGLLVQFDDGSVLAAQAWQALRHSIEEMLAAFHQAEPLRAGMPREELRSRLKVKNATLSLFLNRLPGVVSEQNLVRLETHAIRLTGANAARADALRARLAENPYLPPTWREAVELAGEDVTRALIELGEIVQVNAGVIFPRRAYEEMVAATLEMIDAQGSVTVATVRDRFATSRRFAISLLEHLDATGVTRRVGEVRVRGPKASPSHASQKREQRSF